MRDLGELPSHVEEPRAAERNRRAARSAFEAGSRMGSWRAWHGRAASLVMPVALAAFVGLYLTWAFVSATALLR